MSARITISYETEQELRELTNNLSPVMKKCKISKQNNGGYRKAYIELKNVLERNKVSESGRETEKI